MSNMTPEALRVATAWVTQGPVPMFHRRAQEELRRSWPTLAAAVEALAAAALIPCPRCRGGCYLHVPCTCSTGCPDHPRRSV